MAAWLGEDVEDVTIVVHRAPEDDEEHDSRTRRRPASN